MFYEGIEFLFLEVLWQVAIFVCSFYSGARTRTLLLLSLAAPVLLIGAITFINLPFGALEFLVLGQAVLMTFAMSMCVIWPIAVLRGRDWRALFDQLRWIYFLLFIPTHLWTITAFNPVFRVIVQYVERK